MVIRQETPKDYDAVYTVVKTAFERAEHSDGNEQELVNALRKSSSYIPELSLVAEIDGKVVGYIMFTKVHIEQNVALALAPLAVLPEYQKQGIGKELIKEGHKRAAQLGYGYSVVLGSETYYPQMGYLPAKQFHITPPFDVPDPNYMVYPLNKNSNKVKGTVIYAKEFGIN